MPALAALFTASALRGSPRGGYEVVDAVCPVMTQLTAKCQVMVFSTAEAIMQDLTVTLIQTELAWEDPQANLSHIGTLLDRIDGPTDLVVLPEMFTTGFTMKTQTALIGCKPTATMLTQKVRSSMRVVVDSDN